MEGKRNDITIILHIQRLRRILIVDSGPIVQKPIIFAYRVRSVSPNQRVQQRGGKRKKNENNKFNPFN
jgi:hypothetical protein